MTSFKTYKIKIRSADISMMSKMVLTHLLLARVTKERTFLMFRLNGLNGQADIFWGAVSWDFKKLASSGKLQNLSSPLFFRDNEIPQSRNLAFSIT